MTSSREKARPLMPMESSTSPTLKFLGSIDQIKTLTWKAEVCGHWCEHRHGVWHFRLRDGAVMCWASTTGRIWFQGPEAARQKLRGVIEAALHRWIYPDRTTADRKTRVQVRSGRTKRASQKCHS